MNSVVGVPQTVTGAELKQIYSDSVDDAVYALFRYADGSTGTLETNWSDEAYRKMSTSIVVRGDRGKIAADRQELRVYLKAGAGVEGYPDGWTVRYITDLQDPVSFYLRGEEYSSQLDSFVQAVLARNFPPTNTFRTAYETDWVIDQIARAANGVQ
jgi:predicted dehydrogenase